MNIVCVICSDLLTPSDDVFHTPCGHIFHFVCLTQWLERSKSCPQCREKTTAHKIHRIYFNFSNNDTIVEDASTLQDKLDKMNFQLLLKDKDIERYAEQCSKLEKQNLDLRKEVYKVESELSKKTSSIHVLKEQIKYFKEQCSTVESLMQEMEQLRKRNENYKNIQTLIEASAEDIDEMISRTSDPSTLITYISVMKREMTVSLNKRRELRSKMKSLQQDLVKLSMERNFLSEEHTKRKQLEKDLMVCESQKMSLQNQLRDMERNRSICLDDSDFKAVDKVYCNLNNAPKQKAIKKTANGTNSENDAISNGEDLPLGESSVDTKQNGEKDSLYLPVKSGGLYMQKQGSTQKRGIMPYSSILTKKPRIDQSRTLNGTTIINSIAYDGFGGHSKLDIFPSSCSTKVRKAKEEILKSKKLKPVISNDQKLDDFCTNSTHFE